MNDKQKFRVMRVLVYKGSYGFIKKSFNSASIPPNGIKRTFGGGNLIKSSIVGGMPDLIDDWEDHKCSLKETKKIKQITYKETGKYYDEIETEIPIDVPEYEIIHYLVQNDFIIL
jgi:hypothetical protein